MRIWGVSVTFHCICVGSLFQWVVQWGSFAARPKCLWVLLVWEPQRWPHSSYRLCFSLGLSQSELRKYRILLLVCRACQVAREHVSHELAVCVAQEQLFYDQKKKVGKNNCPISSSPVICKCLLLKALWLLKHKNDKTLINRSIVWEYVWLFCNGSGIFPDIPIHSHRLLLQQSIHVHVFFFSP